MNQTKQQKKAWRTVEKIVRQYGSELLADGSILHKGPQAFDNSYACVVALREAYGKGQLPRGASWSFTW